MRHMTNVLSVVNGLFSTAIRTLYPGYKLPKAFVQWDGAKFGDYKCNVIALAQVSPSLTDTILLVSDYKL